MTPSTTTVVGTPSQTQTNTRTRPTNLTTPTPFTPPSDCPSIYTLPDLELQSEPITLSSQSCLPSPLNKHKTLDPGITDFFSSLMQNSQSHLPCPNSYTFAPQPTGDAIARLTAHVAHNPSDRKKSRKKSSRTRESFRNKTSRLFICCPSPSTVTVTASDATTTSVGQNWEVDYTHGQCRQVNTVTNKPTTTYAVAHIRYLDPWEDFLVQKNTTDGQNHTHLVVDPTENYHSYPLSDETVIWPGYRESDLRKHQKEKSLGIGIGVGLGLPLLLVLVLFLWCRHKKRARRMPQRKQDVRYEPYMSQDRQ